MNWGKTEIWWNDADLDRLHCCCFGMMYFCVFFCFDKWVFGGSSSAGSQPQKERSPIITFFLKCWVRVLFSALFSASTWSHRPELLSCQWSAVHATPAVLQEENPAASISEFAPKNTQTCKSSNPEEWTSLLLQILLLILSRGVVAFAGDVQMFEDSTILIVFHRRRALHLHQNQILSQTRAACTDLLLRVCIPVEGLDLSN